MSSLYWNQRTKRYSKAITADAIAEILFSRFMDCVVPPISNIAGFVPGGKHENNERNDAYYFELGCYFFYELDYWHFYKGYEDFRETWLNDWIAGKFIRLFQDSMKTENLDSILDNRLSLYATLKRESIDEPDGEKRFQKNWSRITFFFEQLAIRALDTGKLEVHDFFNSFPIILEGATRSFSIKLDFGNLVKKRLPPLIDAFQFIYAGIEKEINEKTTGIKENTRYCNNCGKYVSPTFHGLCPDCDAEL
jgi:hypothetical protein